MVCPACRSALDCTTSPEGFSFRCVDCRRDYPILNGIPDFRLKPDRFIAIAADRAKGLRALSLAEGSSFEAALRAYWAITPELSPALASRHIERQLDEVTAGKTLWDEIDRLAGPPAGVMLDLGCTSGGNLVAAKSKFRFAVGIDVGFRWLLLTARRLADHGLSTPLICANAESLPFAGESFDFILHNDLLEHVLDPAAGVVEAARMLTGGGKIYIATNNRFSIAPEPHVRLFGIGWLPRRLQQPYARLRRGHVYDKVRLFSTRSLRRITSQAFGQVSKPGPAPVPSAHLGATMQSVGRWYERIRSTTLGRPLLTPIAPRIQIVAEKLESTHQPESPS